MFSEIENFMNQEFFNNNQTFKIYTKLGNYDAKIFSIYSIAENEEINNIFIEFPQVNSAKSFPELSKIITS